MSFVYGYYYLDKSDFIERLCVNKDKPEMHCDGKCHLKKVAQNNSPKNDKVPFKDVNFKEITLYVVEQTTFNFINAKVKKAEISWHHNLYAFLANSKLDHPPQV